MVMNQIKSPSDTTLYVPALSRITDRSKLIIDNIVQNVQPLIGSGRSEETSDGKHATGENEGGVSGHNVDELDESFITNQISRFIQGIRSQTKGNGVVQGASSSSQNPTMLRSVIHRVPQKDQVQFEQHFIPNEPVPGTSKDGVVDEYTANVEEARDKANQMILDAERYKAVLNHPSGNECSQSNLLNTERNMNNLAINQGCIGNSTAETVMPSQVPIVKDDDEFFHATCHIKGNLRDKIERGQFVELERLLPKTRGSFGEDNRMNLIFKEGKTYFVPAPVSNRINGIRRWEQAFRIYAAIYSQANPHCAAEIWQYVHVINVAAGAYVWDNVSYYDITFRQLMSQNPERSWSKIYNNMWNLAMREPIP